MAIKKPEPGCYMKVAFNLNYDEVVMLSVEDAATLVDLLGRMSKVSEKYNEDPVYNSSLEERDIQISPYPNDKLNDLKKAAFLGISLTEYKEGKNAESRSGTGEEPV